ncbi:hypothetical protein, partial [Demequina sp.]|uniref:hypothetical protein n=1 Tax=Demequina sp. TaxID=2050685 RepID=UPI0025D88AD5
MRTGGWARVAIAAVAAAMLAACAPGQDPVVVGSSQPPQPDSPLATVAPAVTAATDAPAADPVEPPEVEPSGPVESAAGVVTPTTRGSQVGDGRPESCTSAALVRAVRAGGDVTFDCGGQMAIVLDETLTVCNSVGCEPGGEPMALVRVLGGGDITIAGAGERSLLYANTCEESLGTLEGPCEGRTTPRVVLDGLSLIDGSAQAGPRGVAGPLDLDELPGGGAVAMRGGRLSLRDVFFTGNSCGDVDGASGGAVFARDMTAPFEIDGSTFAANTCARGGAIAAIRAPLIITGSSIVDNEAS